MSIGTVVGVWRLGGAAALLLALLAPACSGGEKDPAEAARAKARADSIRYDSLAVRRRAYELSRAEACQGVFKREEGHWSNVTGWKYDGEVDGCWIEYRYDPPKSAAQCDSMFPPEHTTFIKDRLLCHDGRYRTRF